MENDIYKIAELPGVASIVGRLSSHELNHQYAVYNTNNTNSAYTTQIVQNYPEVNKLKNDVETLSRELRELKESMTKQSISYVEPENIRKIKV